MAKKEDEEVIVVSAELQKNLDILQAFKAQVEEMSTNCMQIQIVDDTSLAVAQQNLSKVNALLTNTKNKITSIRKPYNDELKQIAAIGSTLTEPLEKAVEYLKIGVGEWEKKRLAEAAEKQAKIDQELAQKRALEQAEEDRKAKIRAYISEKSSPLLKKMYSDCTSVEICDKNLLSIANNYKPREFFQEFADEAYELKDNYVNLIKTKKEQLLSADQMSEAEIELALERERIAIEKNNMLLREAELKSKEEAARLEKEKKESEEKAAIEKQRLADEAEANKTRGIRYTWGFEINDIKAVPLDWLTLDEVKVKERLKSNKDGLKDGDIVDGVKFLKKMGVSS
ncbi:MAG: hypothetical protein WC055_12020 [Melioribacteraceae bacterium]